MCSTRSTDRCSIAAVEWPEVVILAVYAVLTEFRMWDLRRQATVVRQDARQTKHRVTRVADVLEDVSGERVLRRAEDHDDQDPDQRPLRGG